MNSVPDTASPRPRIDALLRLLYGESVGGHIAAQLADLIAGKRTKQESPRKTAALSERDALLITYADQVREDGIAPLRTLASFCENQLADVFSGIHILPFYPWSSDDGFSVKDFFAVDPVLGDWTDIDRLGQRFDLMFDAVFNHMSAQGKWFQCFLQGDPQFRDFFITVEGIPDLSQVVRPRALPLLTEFQTAAGPKKVWTTFSADQVDLNFKNPDVLLAVMDALLFYVAHGARFIRLDAIAYLWKEIGTSCIHLPQTHRVIQLMRAVLDEVAPDVLLITETNVPHADNISYFGDGTNEAQLVYNFALPPLVLHSLATGNSVKLTRWAQSLPLPSDRVAFFNFLASHDGIGVNPARGILTEVEIAALVERAQRHGGFVSYKQNRDGSKSPYEMNINYFDALSNPAADESLETQVDRFIVAHAVLLALAGVPALYFHSLFGSRSDRAGADATGIPRRINREKLKRDQLEDELSSPRSLRSRVFSELKKVFQVRRAHSAFHPCGRQEVISSDERVFAVIRVSPDGEERVLCLHNVANETVQCRFELPGAGSEDSLTALLGEQSFEFTVGGSASTELSAYQVVWARFE
ncbi:MAG: sugar phosphorylase [Verrucomicrobia bacterium]|nr:sugar phosphorylase [Verrucomicrobiota bacterium]